MLYNDPLAVNYAIALAKAYAYLGNEAKLSDINGRIIDLGYQPIAMNADMAFVDYNQMSASANMKNRQIAQLSLAKEEKKAVAQEKQEDVALKADVDIDIPVNAETNTRTFVYVIANEKYKDVADVPNAANDGKVFAEYCVLVLKTVPLHDKRFLILSLSRVKSSSNSGESFSSSAILHLSFSG